MRHDTHVALSLNALFVLIISMSELFGVFFKTELFIPVLLGVILGSLLPDIDEPESYIGKRLIPIAEIIGKLFGHRGASHYLIVPLCFFIIALLISGKTALFLTGLSFGYLFHILGDLMTLGGIKGLFYPFGQKHKKYVLLPQKFRFRTNTTTENIIGGVLGITFFYQLYLIYKLGVIA